MEPGGPSLIKSVDFWTSGPCLDSLERSLVAESIYQATRVDFSLLRGNEYFTS